VSWLISVGGSEKEGLARCVCGSESQIMLIIVLIADLVFGVHLESNLFYDFVKVTAWCGSYTLYAPVVCAFRALHGALRVVCIVVCIARMQRRFCFSLPFVQLIC